MANRTISLITYATDGTLNTSVTPTVTVSYAGAAASALTPTSNGDYYNVTIDDTQDATLLISGTGLTTDHLVFPRIPADRLAEPGDIPTDYATATAVAAIPTTPLLAANYVAPDNAGIAAIKAKTDNLPADPADQSEVAALIDTLPTLAEIESSTVLATASDIPSDYATSTEAAAIQTRLATMATTSGDFADFSSGYSLQSIRQRGDAAWVTGAGVAANLSYAPTAATRVTGDNEGGDYESLAIVNGVTFSTGEVTTGDLLDVVIDFDTNEETAPIPAGFKVWGNYNGGSGHIVNVYAKEYATNTWESIGSMAASTTVLPYTFDLAPQHINQTTGAASVRFLHSAAVGNVTHALHLDKVEFTAVANVVQDANIVSVADTAVTSVDDFKADVTNLDVAVSSRLAGASYTAPANADIAAIKTKTDNLPANTNTLLTSTGIKVATNADKTGYSGTATNMRGTDNAMLAASYTAPPSAASIASAVRSNLTAELATITSTGALATLLAKHAQNKMTKVDNNNGTMTVTIFDDDNTTPLLTYLYTAATDTRDKAV